MSGTRYLRTSLRILVGIALTVATGSYALAQARIQIPQTPGQVAPTPGTTPQIAPSATGPGRTLELKDITLAPEDRMHVIDWHFAAFGAGGTTGATQPSLTELVIVKPIDASTPLLFERSLNAKVIALGHMVVPLGDQALFRLVLEDIRITSVGRPPGDEALAPGTERVTLTADRYAIRYETHAGTVEETWDRVLNQ